MITLDGIGPVDVTYTDQGEGHPVLLLHGGGGPLTVQGFATLLSTRENARVITPTHPGFAGTPRPEALTTVADLATLYVTLLDTLDLTDVTVVGNSIGGWIATEMTLLNSPRISSVIIVDAVGIDVPDHPVADFFTLTMAEVAQLSYHDPEKYGIDPTKLPPAAQQAMASNRTALATYTATGMTDPTLTTRLATSTPPPTLVVWGEADQIATPAYGKTYANTIPGAEFHLLTNTGHLPQIETPEDLLTTIWPFATKHATR